MRPLEIATAGPYNLFFLLALTLGLLIAWRQGRRAGASHAEWLAVLALAATAGLVGARLLHFDPGAGAGAKTILGGVLLGSAALFAGARFLRIEPRSLDSLALALPLGFAVGRIGCLLAGCCFGHPTDLPWGAIYDSSSAAFRAQIAAGLISADAAESLPVHPTQLYEATLAVFVAAGVPRLRRTLRHPGSLLLAALIALAIGRLLLEFLRARDIATFAGLSQVQWLIAGIACVTALVLIVREGRPAMSEAMTPARIPMVRLLAVASIAPVLLIAGAPLFAPLERLALTLVAIPPVLAVLVSFARTTAHRQHALAMPAVIPGALLIALLQQQPADSSAATGSYPQASWSLSLSYAAREEWERRQVGETFGDCGAIPITEEFDVRSHVAGASLAHTTRSAPGRAWTIRLRGFAGRERAVPEGVETTTTRNTSLGGAGVSITMDRLYFGITGGVAGGRFSGDSLRSSAATTGAIRIGRLDGLHGFAGFNDVEPLGHEDDILRAGLAYGFPGGSAVRAGVWTDGRPYLGATLAVRGFHIEPSVVLSSDYDLRVGISRTFANRQ